MATKTRTHPLIALMRYRMDLMGISPEELAAAIRMTTRCLGNRKNEPEMFRLHELEKMAKKLKITITIGPDGSVKAE